MHPRPLDNREAKLYHDIAADVAKQITDTQVTFNKVFLQQLRLAQQMFDEEIFINELRKQLLVILASEDLGGVFHETEVYDHVYLTLLYLAKHWPFNNKDNNGQPLDAITLQPIAPENLFLTSTGFQFDAKFSKDWFSEHQANPGNREPFNSRDCRELSVFVPKPAPEIHWRDHLIGLMTPLMIGGIFSVMAGTLGVIIELIINYAVPLSLFLSAAMPWILLPAAVVTAAITGYMIYMGGSNFFGEIRDRFNHWRDGRKCQNEHDNRCVKLADMEHANNMPRIPRIAPAQNNALESKREISNDAAVPAPQQSVVPNPHPGLNQLYALNQEADAKPQVEAVPVVPVVKLQAEPQDPEAQLKALKENIEIQMKLFANDRDVSGDLKQINSAMDNLTDPTFNAQRMKVNISRLLSKLREVERRDPQVHGQPDKYANHHACISILDKVAMAIPTLQKFFAERVVPENAQVRCVSRR